MIDSATDFKYINIKYNDFIKYNPISIRIDTRKIEIDPIIYGFMTIIDNILRIRGKLK